MPRMSTSKPVTPAKAAKPVTQATSAASASSARKQAAAIIDALSTQHPNAFTELVFSSPFELLVATVLSAQSTDARVNSVTPTLFAAYPTPAALAAAPLADVERLVTPTGFFRMKARAIVGLSMELVEGHQGEVPASREALVELPGVGRKTANVVLGHAFGLPAFPVDRHVMRVATRLGLSTGSTPEVIEDELCHVVPPERWTVASDTLILHGRRVCRPKPHCGKCAARELCPFARAGAVPSAASQPPKRTGARKRRVV